MVEPGAVVIGLLDEHSREYQGEVLGELRELGATTVCMGSKGLDDLQMAVDHTVNLFGAPESHYGDILYLPFLQVVALHRARVKGLDPDRPRNLDLVVRLNI